MVIQVFFPELELELVLPGPLSQKVALYPVHKITVNPQKIGSRLIYKKSWSQQKEFHKSIIVNTKPV